VAPIWANFMAIAAPIPRPPPVTTAIFWLSSLPDMVFSIGPVAPKIDITTPDAAMLAVLQPFRAAWVLF
jgi:hypothetical protein